VALESLSGEFRRTICAKQSRKQIYARGRGSFAGGGLSWGGGAGDFKKWVAASPNGHLVYEVFGKLRIASAGDYWLCTKSKDGSKLYVDGDLVVSNDGVHNARDRCGVKTLKTGLHLVKAVGFKGDGAVRLALLYQGPDTGNKKIDMQSLDASPF
jgi:hypothetical protein